MQTNNKNIYFLLWIGCIIGAWSLFPYMYYLGIMDSLDSFVTLFLLCTAQAAGFYGLALWISFLILPKTDLKPFSLSQPWSNIIFPGLIFGTLAALTIFSVDKIAFPDSNVANIPTPPYWAGALASLYGGINEEVLLRLFLFTCVYFILTKTGKNRSLLLWITTIITALIFGLGHLPFASQMISLNGFEIFRILLLNGIPGIIFGWLYWSRSFYTASLAHFVTDIFLHVLF